MRRILLFPKYLRKYISIFSLVLLLCMGIPIAVSPQSSDLAWMNEHLGHVLEALMPLKDFTGTYVAYRSHQDLDTDSEFYFRILRESSPSGSGSTGSNDFLSAHLLEPDGISLYQQMLALHQQNPQADVETIESKIRLRKIDLTEGSCPAIPAQIKKLQKVRFNSPSLDMLVLHPLVHQFRMQTPAGNMDVSLIDEKSDLVRWALETKHALEACSGSGS